MEFKRVAPESFIPKSIKAENLPTFFDSLPRVSENYTVEPRKRFHLSRIWGGKPLKNIAKNNEGQKERCTDRYPMALHGPPPLDLGSLELEDDEIRCVE